VEWVASQPNAGGEGVRLVKRYRNRKLYDTRDSRYVTLQRIAEYVRTGEDVQIIDNKTKEDLTNVTLAQIIYEEEKKGEPRGRSVGNLRALIQTGGERLMTSLRGGPLGRLVQKREGEDGEEGDLEGLSMDLDRGPAREALDQLRETADDRLRGLVTGAVSRIQQLQAEVQRLQARIDDLEARLERAKRRSGDG